MDYYILEQDAEIDGCASIEKLPDEIDPLNWMAGKVTEKPQSELILDLSKVSGGFRGDIIDGLVTLYHNELRKSLEKFGIDNIDYFPVKLRNTENAKLEEGYSIANIIGLIECIDIHNSNLTPLPSGIGYDLESFQIDESKTKGLSIFRLAEDPTLVIATEKLVDHLISEGAVGVNFTETTEFEGD